MAQAEKTAPTSVYRSRRSFAKIPDVMDVPNLIAILALSPEVIRLMKDFFSDRPKLTTENLQSWAQEEGGIENVHTKEKLS